MSDNSGIIARYRNGLRELLNANVTDDEWWLRAERLRADYLRERVDLNVNEIRERTSAAWADIVKAGRQLGLDVQQALDDARKLFGDAEQREDYHTYVVVEPGQHDNDTDRFRVVRYDLLREFLDGETKSYEFNSFGSHAGADHFARVLSELSRVGDRR